jgi:adenine-specific DNA-methyltransferase
MPPRNNKNSGPIPVTALKHGDKRVNIPTEELRDFVADAEKAPKTMLYPRDPSLDPQLVWKGKDQQDRNPLQVPVVPIYIQEKIHPQAIVESVRAEARKDTESQADLFSDFNGIAFENLIDFYGHEQNWSNRMILGDSLTVMTSLAEKEGLKGKVQMIYLDPPYGIKFGSNWQVSTRKRDLQDGKQSDASREPEVVKAFRDTWSLGIHSYLAYLRDRLTVARELLTESGCLFLQIGDANIHLVRGILDESFGADNFVAQITVVKTTSATSELLPGVSDYLLLYAKHRERMRYHPLYLQKEAGAQGASGYTWIEAPDGIRSRMSGGGAEPKDGRALTLDNLTSQRPPGDFPVEFRGNTFDRRRAIGRQVRRECRGWYVHGGLSSSAIRFGTFATWTISQCFRLRMYGLIPGWRATQRTSATSSRHHRRLSSAACS